jgi:hypothetical protein
MSSERARLLIRTAIAGAGLPPVQLPAAAAHATPCNATQPAKTPFNRAGGAPNEATGVRPSEPRAAGDMRLSAASVQGRAGEGRVASRPMQPELTRCNVAQPGVTRPPAAPNEPIAVPVAARELATAMSATSLTPRQLAAVRAMLSGAGPAVVAQRLGVSRQTVWRWSRAPAFVAELCRLHTLSAVGARAAGVNKAAAVRV